MSKIRINSISIKNYRSFGNTEGKDGFQTFNFPQNNKPTAIVGYNNSGKTNLMNAIVYGIGEKWVSKDTFDLSDFHNKKIENKPYFLVNATSSDEDKVEKGKKATLSGTHTLSILMDGEEITNCSMKHNHENGKENYDAFGANRYFNIFYINFHKIKEEIKTKKSNWGNISSFLGKHIKKLTEDQKLKDQKPKFEEEIKSAIKIAKNGSELEIFENRIRKYFCKNLRETEESCKMEFTLPDYEDIFLTMVFKIGLNGGSKNFVPIDNFGDGYISMFVMSVIQAIAEENNEDKCLFLFEEPESFLHENHQEYFYKTVLCDLAEKSHQVIYTTHSDKMVDIFDTQNIIRLNYSPKNGTTNAYNDIETKNPIKASPDEDFNIENYNSVIKNIEPNLNKILFSDKVILVEGPNDLMVYKYLIEKKAREKADTDEKIKDKSPEEKEKYAKTYLNFHNITIISHYGKQTAYLLAQLCNHLGVNYFMINDWDFDEDFVSGLNNLEVVNSSGKNGDEIYNYSRLIKWVNIKLQQNYNKKDENYSDKTIKTMITTNKKLLNQAKDNQIHFNVRKLETLIGWTGNEDKNSVTVWKAVQAKFPTANEIIKDIFPESLVDFLEL